LINIKQRIENDYTYKTFTYVKTFINTNTVKYVYVFTSCSEAAKHRQVVQTLGADS